MSKELRNQTRKPREARLRDKAIAHFRKAAFAKYNRGQKEHGGFLPDRLHDFTSLEEEVIDLWFYIQALKHKLDE